MVVTSSPSSFANAAASVGSGFARGVLSVTDTGDGVGAVLRHRSGLREIALNLLCLDAERLCRLRRGPATSLQPCTEVFGSHSFTLDFTARHYVAFPRRQER